MISHDFLCDEPETETTDKKLFFVYQRGLVQENYAIRKIYTDYIQMLKTIQIVAMLQISKRQSPAAAPFCCSNKSKYFCDRLHKVWCDILSRSTINIVLS